MRDEIPLLLIFCSISSKYCFYSFWGNSLLFENKQKKTGGPPTLKRPTTFSAPITLATHNQQMEQIINQQTDKIFQVFYSFFITKKKKKNQ
jgi:hypothetical protein